MLIKTPDGNLVEQPVTSEPRANDSEQEPYSELNTEGAGGTQIQFPTVRAYSGDKLPDNPLISYGKIVGLVADMVEELGHGFDSEEPMPESADDFGGTLGWQQKTAELLQEIANLMVQQGWSTNDLQRAYSIIEKNNMDADLYSEGIPEEDINRI